MPAVLATALIIVAASFIAGRAFLYALGRSRPTWLSGAVGFAFLVIACPLLIRLPGRATTAAIVLGLLLLASLAAMRMKFFAPSPSPAAPSEAPRAAHATALATVLVVLVVACLPFLFNERVGVLGEGIYTNDQAAQLYWTDWLQNGFGPEPAAVKFGYPVGPQAVTAVAAEPTGASLEHAFDGLLIAIPILAGLAALSALSELPPVRRVVAASLTGLPYLAAAFLAQSAFKETAMALLVLATAIALGEWAREGVPKRATLGVLLALAGGSVFVYSLPGLIWLALAVPLWLAIELFAGRRPVDLGAARAAVSRHRWVAIGAVVVLAAVIVLGAGPAANFVDQVGKVQASAGRLSSPISPGEAFGIWPEGDFRLVRGAVSGSIPAAAFALLCIALGLVAAWRRRDTALMATALAGGLIYVAARAEASIYVQAKALAVIAPVLAFTALKGLFAWPVKGEGNSVDEPSRFVRPARAVQTGRRGSRVALALGAAFAIGAAASTFLALRSAPMSFDRRGANLETLASKVHGKGVIFLGLDRFAGYWLRGTLVQSPGGYVPAEVKARKQKPWLQGQGIDFDTVSPHKLDRYRFAITTDAPFQSTPPPNFHRIATAGDYVLYKRVGETPIQKILDGEDGSPGVLAKRSRDCGTQFGTLNGTATVLPKPVVKGPIGWSQPLPFDAPATATRTLRLPPGRWRLSLQYDSQVPLTVRAGASSERLPPSLDGMYLTHQGEGAWWAAGSIRVRRAGPVNVAVIAADPSSLQDALGVERRVWLGGIAATRAAPARTVPVGGACGRYVDHFVLAD